jgi:hypothetical protein
MEADWRLTAAVTAASAAVFLGAAGAMLSTEPSATKTGERRAKPLCKIFLPPNIKLHPPNATQSQLQSRTHFSNMPKLPRPRFSASRKLKTNHEQQTTKAKTKDLPRTANN